MLKLIMRAAVTAFISRNRDPKGDDVGLAIHPKESETGRRQKYCINKNKFLVYLHENEGN